ncbi:MAG TPA: hypothetical protein VFF69_10675 [Phycisphaerales bacterium]|nr:hypothetical protein [Phycisphaerales bacterium]
MPRIRLAWTRSDGSRAELRAELPYASPEQREALGENVQAFVGLGGARLEKGAGHPAGAIVCVGLFKADRDRLFFEDIAHGSDVIIELSNIAFNQPVLPDPDTLVHRLEYKTEDVEACGLTVDQAEMYNVASPDDDLGGAILPQQARFASLDGSDPGDASIDLFLAPGGTVSMRATLPYRLLRHKSDPWGLEVPGTFFEPFHFDLEFQVLPEAVAMAEGVRPTPEHRNPE